MTLKCIATGSNGNCYILTSDSGKHLILDAGVPISEIKQGIDFDVANVEACLVTHRHKDHILSANKVAKFTTIWHPYSAPEFKRLHAKFGNFDIQSFDVPHNGIDNRAFIITVDNTKILYATDYEYIPYDLSNQGINIALVEMNYQSDRIIDIDEHRRHTVLGHAEEKTVVEFLGTIKKNLRRIFLCHMSKSEALDRDLAMKHIREVIPDYIEVEFCRDNTVYDISECPF